MRRQEQEVPGGHNILYSSGFRLCMCSGCYSSSDENINLFINFAGYIAKFEGIAR